MDSPNQASNNQLVLEDALNEADAPLEEGIPIGGGGGGGGGMMSPKTHLIFNPFFGSILQDKY